MNVREQYQKKLTSPKEAVKRIVDGDIIDVHGSTQTSVVLLNELYQRKDELNNVTVSSSLSSYSHDLFRLDCNDTFRYLSTFLGGYERKAIKNGRQMDYFCFQLRNSEILKKMRLRPTVLFVMARPMDEDGYMNLSLSPGSMDVFAQDAREVIVHINDRLPHLEGSAIHISQVTAVFEQNQELTPLISPEPAEEDLQVAAHIVERIPDKACLQIGIGGISNAVGYSLVNHKHLGIHTEMFTESMFYLMQKGAVDNSAKQLDKGTTVTGFASGSLDMYEFLHHNPKVVTKPLSYTNNPYIVAQQDNFISVNSCISVDLTGQVCSESIGGKQFSGTGGQVDFVRGAQMSKGGMSFIAMRSTNTKKDGTTTSKIVFQHPAGEIITTLRTDVQYIVTEYGVADLLHETAANRAKKLIAIAHPDYRDELTYQAKQAGFLI